MSIHKDEGTAILSSLRRPESVLVVIHTAQGHVLLLHRSDMENYWQSVTGGLEHNEQALQAAKREVFEETGITGTPIDRQQQNIFEIMGVWRARFDPSFTHNTEHVFTLEVDRTTPVVTDCEEHVAHVWLAADQALEKVSSETNSLAIEQWVLPLLAGS